MSASVQFSSAEPPVLEFGPQNVWGGLSAMQLRAGPGLHGGDRTEDHRLILYLSSGVPADCSCEGLSARRIQVAGRFDLVPAGAAGFWKDELPCDMVSVRIAPALLLRCADALAIRRDSLGLAPQLDAHEPLVEQVVRSLLTELRSPAPAGRLFVESLGVALTTRLLQGYALIRAPTAQRLSKPQERRLAEYIESHLDEGLSLDDLAAVAGISVPHLTPLFRRTFGQTVHRYVMERRVARARDLLAQGHLSITEVALECGFSHASHLARWMRRLVGVRPSEISREGWSPRIIGGSGD